MQTINKNCLSLDFGTKNIGLAYSVNGIIFTLPPIANNDQSLNTIVSIINTQSIGKIYIGLSTGKVAKLTSKFIKNLSAVVKLPIETVEESVSTIEATSILKLNRNNHQLVDSVSAAVILRRVIN